MDADLVTAAAALLTLPAAGTLLVVAQGRAGAVRYGLRLLAVGVVLAAGSVHLGTAATTLAEVGVVVPPVPPLRVAMASALTGGLAAVVLLAGLVLLAGVTRYPGNLLRYGLDALAVAAALSLTGSVVVAQWSAAVPDGPPPRAVPMVLAAVVAAVAVGVVAVCVHRAPRPRVGAVSGGLGVCLLVAACCAAVLARCWEAAGLVDPGFTAAGFTAAGLTQAGGIALVVGAVAVVGALRAGDPTGVSADEALLRGTAAVLLPLAAGSVAAFYHLVTGGRFDGYAVAAWVAMGLALVLRYHLASIDVRRYSQRLENRESHFRELAHTDSLTGLTNRRGLMAELYTKAVGGPPCVLLVLDLDAFKSVNDVRGHDAGDAVLTEVARRLRTNLRPGDVAARLGGDEFAVLTWAQLDEARSVAHRLLRVLSKPYQLPNGTVFLSASIGMAGCASADDIPTLLRNADLALRSAKQQGKGRVEAYDAAYDTVQHRRNVLDQELRGAIDRGELYLAYQPVVALGPAAGQPLGGGYLSGGSGYREPGHREPPAAVRPVGAEALLRWHHPQLGQIGPDEFIPVAEESGMISKLGGWVLHQACHQLSRWLADGLDVWVSVNVSPRELHATEYVNQVTEALTAHRVPPQRLVLEVTEHAVATDLDELIRRLASLRSTGVRIALDDFGAGYSSLGQLRRLPVDILKIDQSLVVSRDPEQERAAAPLVDVVVRLGQRLGLEVIAEGVSEPAQHAVVVEAGCRFGQGMLFGSAVPAEYLEAQLFAALGAVPVRPAPPPPDPPPALPAGPRSVPPPALPLGSGSVPPPALPLGSGSVPLPPPPAPPPGAQIVGTVDSAAEIVHG